MRFTLARLSLALFLAFAALLPNRAIAQCSPGDIHEDNDDCASAVPLALGGHTGLSVSHQDDDYYVVTVPAYEHLYVTMTPSDWAPQNYFLELYDDQCVNLLAVARPVNTGIGDISRRLTWENSSAGPTNVRVRVETFLTSGCRNYTISFTGYADDCLTPAFADVYEDNDDCGSAAPLAAGSYADLTVSSFDPDYFVITVPPLERLRVHMYPDGGDAHRFGVNINNDSCSAILASADPDSGDPSLSCNWTNTSGTAQDVRVWIGASHTVQSCIEYDLSVTLIPDSVLIDCANPALDDAFEDNDTCQTAVPIAIGGYGPLRVGAGDRDYYAITVPPGASLTARATLTGTQLPDPLNLSLIDASDCSTVLDVGIPVIYSKEVYWQNTSGAPVDTILFVGQGGGYPPCRHYYFSVLLDPGTCTGGSIDDPFEDNEDCASATPMDDGLVHNLTVQPGDDDVYEIELPDGQTLTADLLLPFGNADLDVYLYEDSPTCGDGVNHLQHVNTAAGNVPLVWTNTSGAVRTYYLQVRSGTGQVQACTVYELRIGGTDWPEPTPFCFGDGTADAGAGPVHCPCNNDAGPGSGGGCLHSDSIGFGAILSATGTTEVAADDLSFTISGALPHQTGMLIQGQRAIAVPFKGGVLCMGNETRRLEAFTLDAAGSATTTSSIVTEGAISVGRTRHYQAWFRDPGGSCGTGSNFTQGLTVVWH